MVSRQRPTPSHRGPGLPQLSQHWTHAGQFFAAVTSTGIYCRPGCPARMPKRENVRFYLTAAAARSDGFRACLRCRPDEFA